MIQFDILKGQTFVNLDTVWGYLGKLVDQGTSLAVLPEMFTCSFDNEMLTEHAEQRDDLIGQFCEFSQKNKIAVTGSLPKKRGTGIVNSMFFVDMDGQLVKTYEKLHLFRLTGEDKYYTPGDNIVVIDTDLGKIGLMICYDLRFPELARSLYLSGAQMILVCAQWPKIRQSHWTSLVRARAIENQLFMITCNRVGHEDGLEFTGRSMIVDPLGEILADAGQAPGIAVADIDIEKIEQARAAIPCLTDRRTDIYG